MKFIACLLGAMLSTATVDNQFYLQAEKDAKLSINNPFNSPTQGPARVRNTKLIKTAGVIHLSWGSDKEFTVLRCIRVSDVIAYDMYTKKDAENNSYGILYYKGPSGQTEYAIVPNESIEECKELITVLFTR